ncbi:flagellar biosynthesis protein FlhF [Marinomonas sp. SBI22]|uniref:flagellar biosynthesis protein FlhF n=1 Tax=unclassified Marinomonas TaxID=196814 RepID=UPI0007AF4E33|nr:MULTISPECIES: flagellar biosynthesis protein FlhF [unclassified Marinomonas]KZM40024.1 flagellar biosynthesis protein FlhF [Marinomonas sp. SBI22]KZM41318.1 flagellar biosynthesis protein FlhF [Marinomonas sp. SBI8L]
MQIRRFRAADMRQAIRKVRDAVGPDAVILSNQRLASGEIEIVAALDYDGSMPSNYSSQPKPEPPPVTAKTAPQQSYQERIEQAKQPEISQVNHQADLAQKMSSVPANKYVSMVDEDPVIEESLSIKQQEESAQLKEMEAELQKVKELLEQQRKLGDTKKNDLDPAQAKVKERLTSLGLSSSIVSGILDDVELLGREDDWNRVLSHLAEHIPVKKQGSEMHGCYAFMGPTGVGKTTTIGKIAAQHVLKHGSDSVVLVTTDTYRIAAHEQLRTFGRILNVPVVVVNEYSDLNEVLDKYSNFSLVLVDTAGMNPRDRNLERQLLMMKRAHSDLKKLLVLPCTSQRQVLKTVVDVYAQVQLDGCVLSKLDESASLGEAVSVVIEERLPVVYIADGQRIPDDIQPARAHNIISRAVYTAEQYSHIYSSLKYGS